MLNDSQNKNNLVFRLSSHSSILGTSKWHINKIATNKQIFAHPVDIS